ncbi:Nucleolar GTP-binding protein 2 [Pleurostoma richardsiae]|uniref:Nucleolar GTP-binding protein 2 n=1 Tax=Pleurostoma richardsiae TaxID=41990 RepID=A0AA38VUK4_9PEZI|nr:Nucleolar GTP-binding protein 2 [Pleurostoma richardsiae]
MGTFKKEKSRRTREGTKGEGVHVKGENFYRTAKRVKQLNVLKGGKPVRNKDGIIVQDAAYQSREVPNARIEPNRKWFTNSRVISQDSLNAFREAIAEKQKDPYQVLLKTNKLPMSLIQDGSGLNGLKQHQAKMTIETEPFSDVFGPKAQRKRPKLSVSTMADFAQDSVKSFDTYKERLEEVKLLSGKSGEMDGEDGDVAPPEDFSISTAVEPIFSKGQSKRIWNELYKVIDSSDVILHVLDARDVPGTRCYSIEKYLQKEAPHKHLVFVLNKVDLVPTSVAAAWVKHLQKDRPTAAFRASLKNPFGRGSLINLLRQFSKLHSERKQVSVGIIGYPNTGKSSLINALKGKQVCTTAPIPGETKVWQYVTLMKRIYLIDCPGVVPQSHKDEPTALLLRGVVRVENVEHPEQYIPAVLSKVKKHHMARTYDIPDWNDHIHFLELLARKSGRLLKGGEPDVDSVAKQVLNDFMRGKIPWFTPAPVVEGEGAEFEEGRQGRLGEMPKKRKREDAESIPDTSKRAPDAESDESSDDEFEGFGSESEPESGEDSADEEDSEGDEEDDSEGDMIPLEDSSEEEGEGGAEDDDGGGRLAEVDEENEIEEAAASISRRGSRKRRRRT